MRIFSILLEPDQRTFLDEVARAEGVSTGRLIRRLIVAALRAEGHDVPEATR